MARDDDDDPKANFTPAYLFGLFMIILAAIAVAIFIGILVVNKEKLSIDRATEYPREEKFEIELKD
jgi:NADH:ubiquinone oxidoreductase subunit K